MKPIVSRTFIEAAQATRSERPSAVPGSEEGAPIRRFVVALVVLGAVLAAGAGRFGGPQPAPDPVSTVHEGRFEQTRLHVMERMNELGSANER
jgi:hypothetical protein